MPVFFADLHNHTPASADHRRPATSAEEIVESALGAGLQVYAATDHLSCALVAELMAEARRVESETSRPLLVIPGMELRITYLGDEVHIVALFEPEHHVSHFNALMGLLGITSARFAYDDLPLVTCEYDPVGVCRAIDALGGIACVAHADRVFGDYRFIDTPLFRRLAAEPTVAAIDLLDLEVRDQDALSGLSACIIQCSDSHSCERIGERRSLITMKDLSFASLRTALQDGKVATDLLA